MTLVPMPAWTPAALGGAVCIAVYYTLVRAASGRIGDRWGALVVEIAASLVVAASLVLGPRDDDARVTRAGVLFATAGGVAVAGASVLLFVALRRGGPVASTGTIVLGGGVALSAAIAPWAFGEGVTLRRIVGVALGLAAMWVLGADW